jgi:hypothetical protein
MNNGIEVDDQLVNNDKMASYSQVVSGNNRQDKNQDTDDTNEHNNQVPKQGSTQSHYRESDNVKPIFSNFFVLLSPQKCQTKGQ